MPPPAARDARSPAERIREALGRPPGASRPVCVAGAHDALSAKLAEEAGFDAIWASGFGISAVQGVPDANILTLTETLEAVRRIVDATTIPVIADCDNGFGNSINVMRTVAEFERAGAAAICIEDNEFPKRCSFYAGVRRELVPAGEHARKLQAAAAARRDPATVIIARTEALIAGLGLQEALRRARTYAEAGADAILVHSKARDFDELREFAAEWDRPVPLVAVPTTYPAVGRDELEAAGFRMVIFANQALRAAIAAMRDALGDLRRSGRAASVEERIVPLEDVYALVGVPQLRQNEQRFLVAGEAEPRAVILAAGFEPELLPLVRDRPKTMLEVKGKSILARQVEALHRCGVRDVLVVRGYQKEQVAAPGVRLVDNDRFADTGELYSLFRAEQELDGPFILLYGDILFEAAILVKLLQTPADIAVVVDRAFPDAFRAGLLPPDRPLDLVVTENAARGRRFVSPEKGSRVLRLGPQVSPAEAHGEFIGMAMFSVRGAGALRALHAQLAGTGVDAVAQASIPRVLQMLIDQGEPVIAVDIHKGWMEVDTVDDYRRACADVGR